MSNQAAGFPPGIHPGGLLQRVLAHVIDMVLPSLLLSGATASYLYGPGEGLRIALAVICVVLALGWAALLWWMFATRGAGFGMKVMKLELVAVESGEPIGWVRYLIRMLIFFALSATSVGLIVMLIVMVMNPRRQGWHDLAARSVVIQARDATPPQLDAHGAQRSADSASPYGQQGHGQQGQYGQGQHGQPQSAASASQAPVGSPVGLPPGLSGQTSSGFAPTHDERYGGQGQPGQGQGQPQSGHQQSGHQQGRQQPGPWQQQPASGSPWGPGSAAPSSAGSASGPQSERSAFGRPQSEPPMGQPSAGQAPVAGVPSFGSEVSEEVESTRLVPSGANRRPPNQGWAIMLADGRLVDVESLILLGRNPQPRAGEEGAELIQISDTSRTVSKTHIAIGVDTKGIWVMDRGSTNGSAIAASNGSFEPCAPGDLVRVREGQVVSFGEQRFEIRRSYGS
ncbi:RDD family protein [Propionibacteriaceae bacterium Y1685]